jgi:chromosome segregation ATPase
VEESRPVQNTYQLSSIDAAQVALFVRQASIDRVIEESLHRILAQKAAVAELESRKDGREEEMTKIFDDQQRLRENMKSLKGSNEEKQLLQRYTQQLNEQENRLEAIRKDIERLQMEAEAADSELDKLIENLAFDSLRP